MCDRCGNKFIPMVDIGGKKSKLCFKCKNIKREEDRKMKRDLIIIDKLKGRKELLPAYKLMQKTLIKNFKNTDVEYLKQFRECIDIISKDGNNSYWKCRAKEIDKILSTSKKVVDWDDWDTPLS